MRRRSLHIILVGALVLLSIGEAYHYHPGGGQDWRFVAVPIAASSSTTDAPDADNHAAGSHSSHSCLLHFWSSLLSTTSISLSFVLVPPTTETTLREGTLRAAGSWTELPPSIRGPPTILS